MDGILLLGQKSCIWDIKFKIYWVSKSIPTAKSQNFLNISGSWKTNMSLIFLSEETRLRRYYQRKNQLVVTSSSYIYRTMKLLIKAYLLAKKQGKSKILLFFGNQYLIFASDRLFIFSTFIVLQVMMKVNWESEFNLFWKINDGSLKLL